MVEAVSPLASRLHGIPPHLGASGRQISCEGSSRQKAPRQTAIIHAASAQGLMRASTGCISASFTREAESCFSGHWRRLHPWTRQIACKWAMIGFRPGLAGPVLAVWENWVAFARTSPKRHSPSAPANRADFTHFFRGLPPAHSIAWRNCVEWLGRSGGIHALFPRFARLGGNCAVLFHPPETGFPRWREVQPRKRCLYHEAFFVPRF